MKKASVSYGPTSKVDYYTFNWSLKKWAQKTFEEKWPKMFQML